MAASERIATIDVGTNTALLLVSEWKYGRLKIIGSGRQFVRLGEGIDASGMVSPKAMTRLRNALLKFRDRVAELQVSHTIVVGTSASRDAANRDELIALVRDAIGAEFDILSGTEEAGVSFLGAVNALNTGYRGSVVVVDVGGGSTELVSGRRDTGCRPLVQGNASLNVGTLRVTERFFKSNPPSDAERIAATNWMDGVFSSADIPVLRNSLMLGASGTSVVLALLHFNADTWVQIPRSGAVLSKPDVDDWADRLLAMSPQSVLSLNPRHLAGREDVFASGVLILSRIMHRFEFDSLHVVPSGLRYGLALQYFCHLHGGDL